MDGLKLKAGEKIELLHNAAVTAADNGKSKVEEVVNHTVEAIRKVKAAFQDIWHNELMTEARQKVSDWAREAANRIREGAPPLSPVLLYEELVNLWKDRVWRRSVAIFIFGCAVGGGVGLTVGLRLARGAGGGGPRARALHSQPDQTVMLVDDAVAPAAGYGEVLVRVQAFSVQPSDRGVLRGYGAVLRSLLGHTAVTVGRAFAGVILDVGEGVHNLEMGDEVWGCLSEWSGGCAAELLTIRSTRVSRRAGGLAADAAAAAGPALSALHALRRLRYSPDTCKGKRVCICGAASGEGCALVQLLSAWGATVFVSAPRQSAFALKDLGASEYIDTDDVGMSWSGLETYASRHGPWDAVLACAGPKVPLYLPNNIAALLKATAPRDSVVDVRPQPLLSDRLQAPFSLVFALSFYSFRVLRWLVGCGSHTDWLEDRSRLTPGLEELAQLVEQRVLSPVLDKVYLPQDFESALAHACSEDAYGTTVIRFP